MFYAHDNGEAYWNGFQKEVVAFAWEGGFTSNSVLRLSDIVKQVINIDIIV